MGKALEEQLRKDNFRKILVNLINEEISNLESSYQRVITNISENSSKYAGKLFTSIKHKKLSIEVFNFITGRLEKRQLLKN